MTEDILMHQEDLPLSMAKVFLGEDFEDSPTVTYQIINESFRTTVVKYDSQYATDSEKYATEYVIEDTQEIQSFDKMVKSLDNYKPKNKYKVEYDLYATDNKIWWVKYLAVFLGMLSFGVMCIIYTLSLIQ